MSRLGIEQWDWTLAAGAALAALPGVVVVLLRAGPKESPRVRARRLFFTHLTFVAVCAYWAWFLFWVSGNPVRQAEAEVGGMRSLLLGLAWFLRALSAGAAAWGAWWLLHAASSARAWRGR